MVHTEVARTVVPVEAMVVHRITHRIKRNKKRFQLRTRNSMISSLIVIVCAYAQCFFFVQRTFIVIVVVFYLFKTITYRSSEKKLNQRKVFSRALIIPIVSIELIGSSSLYVSKVHHDDQIRRYDHDVEHR
jgi:hypothetical protein